jgi:transcriptional regulator with XRE-family HTH domain
MGEGMLPDYVGRVLRRERERKQISQADVASRAKVSTATISRFERGLTWPSLRTWRSIIDSYAACLDRTRLELFEIVLAAWQDDEDGRETNGEPITA